MRELPTIEAAAKANSAKLHKLWEGLGYYTRVRNLQKATRVIVEKHGGRFPKIFDDVLALPGIGRYTAGAICSIAFNQPTPILDGNVIRVLTRLFGIAENPKEKVTNARLWQLAEDLVGRAVLCPPRRGEDTAPYRCSHLNQSLMELGALVCTPRHPHCLICPVKKLCVAFKEKRVNELPNLGKRETATARCFLAFVVERDGKFLVRQRPAGVVNAHLWEFPNVEVAPNQSGSGCESAHFTPNNIQSRLASAATDQGLAPAIIRLAKPLCTVKHSITRYRMTLEAFRSHIKSVPPKTAGAWKTPAQMEALAFTSAHRKVLRALAARAGY
jgi:A/G-specific adenine glycosylase